MSAPRSPRATAALALALALAVAAWAHARAWDFVCDDAYISFRYARNLALHGALEYNLGERVEGFSNPLWVLILALGDRLGVAPEILAPALTQAGAGALLVVGMLLLRRLRGRAGAAWGLGDVAPAALLIAAPEVMVWAHSGLETSAAAALVLGACLAWLAGRPRAAALIAGLAGLCRLDALVPIAAFGIAWLVVVLLPARLAAKRAAGGPEAASGPRLGARELVGAALIFAALLGGLFVARRLYYDAWLPNTWAIKRHGALLRGTYGVEYVRAWAAGLGLVYAAPLLVLLRPRHLLLGLPAAASVAYAYSVGGDFMAYSRLLLPASAALLLLVAWLVADGGARLAARWPRLGPLAPLLTLALAGALGARAEGRWADDRARPSGWIDGRWEGVTAMDRFARERLHVGRWMRDNLPEGTWITVGAAGALPYASELGAIDVFGLVDPAIARLPGITPQAGERGRPGHQLVAPRSYVQGRDPDLYCHVGHVGQRRPAPASARRRGFGPRMVWACVEPGAIADPHEPDGILDLGFYCCLRPAGRAVGPFVDGPG
ncbi:MAG: hypothetical protein H6711_02455 [Myxococcales bacterium]|nr:hypothetical protein [Myxococcales bacterium]